MDDRNIKITNAVSVESLHLFFSYGLLGALRGPP